MHWSMRRPSDKIWTQLCLQAICYKQARALEKDKYWSMLRPCDKSWTLMFYKHTAINKQELV